METKFIPAQVEAQLYKFWEDNGYFTAKPNKEKKAFTIILPPPNANADLHLGHAMYTYEDVMIRYHKLVGDEALWLPGADHAGIETQFVFEKHLKKEGKSRFDFDRETLFKMIWSFVMENKGHMENQIRALGFAVDWSKQKFTMDEDIVKIVYGTFEDLFKQNLVYRAEKLVNYCTNCGTSYSDLEVHDKETEGILYHIKFPIKDGGDIVIATTRPETFVGDVAVMVNPKDKRYSHLMGQTVVLPLVNREVPIIGDEYVDMKFGTGAVKVTPAHDFNDFEIAKKHGLTFPPIVGFDGKMQNTKIIDGLYVKAARVEIVKQLEEAGFLVDKKPHKMVLKVCYRCGMTLEPLPKEQWFIKVKPLADQAKEMVEKGEIKVHPKRFTKQLIRILDNFIDWNISRQIVWGIRIPAYQCAKTQKWFVSKSKPVKCQICDGCTFKQDEDTFDTWFSSSQWPFATLQSISKEHYDYFYPTSVMETGYDILRAWVARMIMVGSFATKKPPFQNIYLHGMVRDRKGQKMSKSKGNVINPLEMVEKYGADALRAALIFGSKAGNDVVLSEDKIVGMRNFANKVWNIGRFIEMNETPVQPMMKGVSNEPVVVETVKKDHNIEKKLKKLEKELETVQKKYKQHMEKYNFSQGLELVYHFLWHSFADVYIEELKDELWNGNIRVLETLKSTYFENLKMLHPFMPFVTEAIWQTFKGEKTSILSEKI